MTTQRVTIENDKKKFKIKVFKLSWPPHLTTLVQPLASQSWLLTTNLESTPYTVQPRRLYRHHYCLDPDGKFKKFFIPWRSVCRSSCQHVDHQQTDVVGLTKVLSFEQDSLTADSSSQRLPECRLQPHPTTLCCPSIVDRTATFHRWPHGYLCDW